jgi:peptidoglycan/LPS O-acetylase OafA/YrhL
MPRSPIARVGSGAVERLRDVTKQHWPALDAFRGFAIFVVLVHNVRLLELKEPSVAHTAAGVLMLALERAWYHLEVFGWAGVQLFFVLSGFLITGILLDTKDEPGALRRFLVRRGLRIFPLYYATLFVLLVVVPPDPVIRAALHDQVYYWLYVSNWAQPFEHKIPTLAHFWSLAVEEQFYLLWPLLVLKARRPTVARIAWGMVSVALVVRLACVAHAWPTAAYQLTISRFDGLAVGALLALAVRDERWGAWLAERSALWLVPPVILLGVCAVVDHGLDWDGRSSVTIGQTALAFLFALTIAFAAKPTMPAFARRLLAWRPLRALGGLSYAVYAFHVPIAYYTHNHALAIVGNTVGMERVGLRIAYAFSVLTASVLLALVSGALLERPILRLKAKVA